MRALVELGGLFAYTILCLVIMFSPIIVIETRDWLKRRKDRNRWRDR